MSGADPRVRAVLKLAPVIPVFTPENVDDAVQVAVKIADIDTVV